MIAFELSQVDHLGCIVAFSLPDTNAGLRIWAIIVFMLLMEVVMVEVD